MEPTEQQMVDVPQAVTGKTRFGFGQIGEPTPIWAKWVFRVYFYIASVVTVVVTTDDAIPATAAKQIARYLAMSTLAVHGASKLFGVKIDSEEFKVL